MEVEANNHVESRQREEYTKDGTVDLKGNAVLRSRRGGWRACSFLVAYEVVERMAYYGIATNLILYLTNKLHQGTVTASNNVTNWIGTVWLTPIIGGYIADAYLGRYWTFIIASFIYLAGMCLLTLSVSLPSLKPDPCGPNTGDPNCTQEATALQLGFFFCGLYILAAGTGGTKPNISTIGADQFDEFDPRERMHKISFFNWWMFSIFFGTLLASTVLVYIQDNVGWTAGYALSTLCLLVSIAIFVAGTPFYRHRQPDGNSFTKMARVIAAAARKCTVRLPSDPKDLHELEVEAYGTYRIDSTLNLRILNKAAVKSGPTSPWMLCTVTQVEETKQLLRMIPIFISTIIPGTMYAQTFTLFVKQGTKLDRHIGLHFEIPPASLSAFITISMLVIIILYDRIFVPMMRRWTGNPRGISLLQRMGIGMAIHIVIMSISSLTEHRRLAVAKEHGLVESGAPVPLTIFTLVPQFVLMGVADAFLEVGKIEFFYDQAPAGMKSLGTSFSLMSLGAGNFLSSFLLSTVENITRDRGDGWILNNLNKSHLDYYYAFLAVLDCLNLAFFLVVSHYFVYRAETNTVTEGSH